jgi:hypothetical protein
MPPVFAVPSGFALPALPGCAHLVALVVQAIEFFKTCIELNDKQDQNKDAGKDCHTPEFDGKLGHACILIVFSRIGKSICGTILSRK